MWPFKKRWNMACVALEDFTFKTVSVFERYENQISNDFHNLFVIIRKLWSIFWVIHLRYKSKLSSNFFIILNEKVGNKTIFYILLSLNYCKKRYWTRDSMKNYHLIAKKLNNPYLLNISDSINLCAAFCLSRFSFFHLPPTSLLLNASTCSVLK